MTDLDHLAEERDRIAEETERLLRTARALDELAVPSRCPGWTRGHVLAHLARNADALTTCVRSAVDGTGETMYASNERRDADIEAGAGRPLEELVEDNRATAERFAAEMGRLHPGVAQVRVERTPGGLSFPARLIPLMRLREVVFHHVDLDAGFGFGGLDSDVLSELLADHVLRLTKRSDTPAFRVRTDEGDTFAVGEDGPLVTGTRGGVLLWLARQDPSAVSTDRPDRLPTLPTGV